ncbi:MAG: sortase [Microgenomates group bacterium]
MYPQGVIYEKGRSDNSGEFSLRPSLTKRILYHLARGIGTGFIAFAIVGLIFSYYPILKEEIAYKAHKVPKIGFGDLISQSSAEDYGLDPFFSIYVPKINAKASVIPNVNAGNYNEYTRSLQEGVAHASGTNFPGQGKLIYLFSHSTDSPLNFARYNAVFYLLRKLEPGDRVVIFFMGQEYKYIVEEKVITEPDDNSWLIEKGQGESLVLQTCDPPGTSLRRLIIVAKPINY